MTPIRILILLILFFSSISCETDERKNDLLGVWESYEPNHTKSVLTFYKDSLILDALGGGFHTNSKWSVDEYKIYLKKVRLMDTILKEKMSYEYKLNLTKDSLYIKVVDGKDDEFFTLKKVDKNPFTAE